MYTTLALPAVPAVMRAFFSKKKKSTDAASGGPAAAAAALHKPRSSSGVLLARPETDAELEEMYADLLESLAIPDQVRVGRGRVGMSGAMGGAMWGHWAISPGGAWGGVGAGVL